MSDLGARVLKTVGRHFVTLSCVRTAPGTNAQEVFVFSGFLMEIVGVWFYVTAGHIVRGIRTSLEAGFTFDRWRLDDQTAGNQFNGAAVPYDFRVERWLVIEDETVGLDYAVVVLDEFFCKALKAGGAVPLAEETWGDHLTEADRWALVGIPSETVLFDQVTAISARVVIIPLEQTSEPLAAGRKAENQFYARITDPGRVKNIDGMSGGPVFALKFREGRWWYMVIGVQSAWYSESKVIAACPFSSLTSAIKDMVESIVRQQPGEQTHAT